MFRLQFCPGQRTSNLDNAMSSAAEPDFDLEKHFLPDWAKRPASENRYASYAGEPEEAEGRKRPRRNRLGQRPGSPGPAQPKPAQPRRAVERSPQPKPAGREDRPAGPKPQPELPRINVAFVPDDQGVESLTRQIRITGRAYPLFEIAQMILEKPERYTVTLSVRKNPEGTIQQPMFVCALDDTVWLSEEEAIQWTLDQHFTTFYQPDRTRVDPPKGTYTFVAQCGLSGVILGPPNYHGYQEALRKLHASRFPKMPFEAFKARVNIVRDEAVVKKWLEDQSWRTQYICLNLPEPLKLSSREEVEKHFREVHAPIIIRQAETVRLSGPASRRIRQPALARLVRVSWEQQRRFPIQVATVLSQQFGSRHLQFFKAHRSITYVAVARPRYLDLESAPVSDNVRRIVQFITEHPKCTRRDLLAALAPRPGATEPGTEPTAAEAAPAEPTPEETQVIADLHWLVHQGHVIEFANGILETAKKPVPKPKPAPQPPQPAAQPQERPAAESAAESPRTEGAASPLVQSPTLGTSATELQAAQPDPATAEGTEGPAVGPEPGEAVVRGQPQSALDLSAAPAESTRPTATLPLAAASEPTVGAAAGPAGQQPQCPQPA